MRELELPGGYTTSALKYQTLTISRDLVPSGRVQAKKSSFNVRRKPGETVYSLKDDVVFLVDVFDRHFFGQQTFSGLA